MAPGKDIEGTKSLQYQPNSSEIHHCSGLNLRGERLLAGSVSLLLRPQPSPSSCPGAREGPVVPPAPCGCARGLTCPRSKSILCIQLHSTRLMKLRLTVCSPDNQLLWGVQTPTVRDSSNKALAGLPLRPTLTSLVLQEDPNFSSPSPSRRGAYFLLQTSWD